jgi:hypothetical protein
MEEECLSAGFLKKESASRDDSFKAPGILKSVFSQNRAAAQETVKRVKPYDANSMDIEHAEDIYNSLTAKPDSRFRNPNNVQLISEFDQKLSEDGLVPDSPQTPKKKHLDSDGNSQSLEPYQLRSQGFNDTDLKRGVSSGSEAGYAASRFENDFEVLAILGKGNFGTVKKCRNRLDDSLYAVKITEKLNKKSRPVSVQTKRSALQRMKLGPWHTSRQSWKTLTSSDTTILGSKAACSISS